MHILILSKYSRKAASSRQRFYQYLPFLEKEGIKCKVSPFFDDAYLQAKFEKGRANLGDALRAYLGRTSAILEAKKYDLLIIHYEVFPYLPAFFEAHLKWRNIPYVLDYDDAIFHTYDKHRSKFVRLLLGKKIAFIARHSSAVLACNEYLAEYARRAGARRIEILPTVIDIGRYLPKLLSQTDPSVFTIGWIGSPSTSSYVETIAPALSEVCTGGRGKVVLIGSKRVELPNVPVEIIPWSEESEVAHLQAFDVGIMPLNDSFWARGKCGFKLIQYMACGLPVVASPVGVNREIVEDGANGFWATTLQEWVRALSRLRDNKEMREKMGCVGRRKVETGYSLQVAAPRLVALLRDLDQGKCSSNHETETSVA
jgi:glycosyltransferase involved in cell wall biosynthesis